MGVKLKILNRQNRWSKIIDRWVGIPLVFGAALPLKLLGFFKSKSPEPTRPLRILVIKLSALGDGVVMIPALHLLHSETSGEITFLGTSSIKPIILKLPLIKNFLSFNLKNLFHVLFHSYDLVIDFEQWMRASALTATLAGPLKSFGFSAQNQYRHFAYREALPFDLYHHTAENFWNLARFAMTKALKNHTLNLGNSTFAISKKESRAYFLKTQEKNPSAQINTKPFIVIHPGCGDHGIQREWPLDHWQSLIQMIKVEEPDVTIFITGTGAYESKLAQTLADQALDQKVISLVEKLSFDELIQTALNAKAIYCSNTGVMHLASLVNDLVFALHGPTRVKLWGPVWGGKSILSEVKCSPCLTWGYDYGCSDAVCMKIISPKQVFDATYA